MTTITRRVSSVLAICSLALASYSCTDSEQQAQIDRQKRIEQQEAQDKADQERKAAQAAAEAQAAQPTQEAAPQPEETPEAPTEPEKVDNYILVGGTTCQCLRIDPCGVTAYGCSNGKSYACKHDVEYTVVSVDKTDDNNGNCD